MYTVAESIHPRRPFKSLPKAVLTALLALVCGAASTSARADGEIKKGAEVFATQCAECHSLKEGKHKKGPSLFALLGRPSAGLAGVAYSDAMKASKWTWSAEKIDIYISAPKAALPGGTMKFDGLTDAHARADLLAFLASVK
ncbi:c-type cytochrome [Paucibacter sp. TC2R-5]|uniref:c-type cytochrome n=1 Tax=Paucibacter sp. TC2R-5 TaxID=2893555 RepID=UPI0021E42774|nr:c-type cytochrome [Paucibacter sp. TC2R-5]MCV2361632.1 c-type cytochrome [Paucibacter sp. TC2R-5]